MMANVCGLIQGSLRPGLGLCCSWFHSLFKNSHVDCLSPILGLNYELSLELSYSLCMALLAAHVGLVLWTDYGLVMDSLGSRSRTFLC